MKTKKLQKVRQSSSRASWKMEPPRLASDVFDPLPVLCISPSGSSSCCLHVPVVRSWHLRAAGLVNKQSSRDMIFNMFGKQLIKMFWWLLHKRCHVIRQIFIAGLLRQLPAWVIPVFLTSRHPDHECNSQCFPAIWPGSYKNATI